MIFNRQLVVCICLITAISLTSCKARNKNSQSATESTTTSSSAGGTEVGIEKVKPAPGTGNVQGKVLYNSKPVENIEVKLCETFSQYLGGCSGKSYTARTDKNGEYVITNVEPKEYEGLLARVFDTDSYVFATSGIGGISSSNAPGGPAYSAPFAPAELGSGGGSSYEGPGGAGGGSIRLLLGGNFILNGTVTANGSNGTNSRSGGGSGGSVWITATNFLSNGTPMTFQASVCGSNGQKFYRAVLLQ